MSASVDIDFNSTLGTMTNAWNASASSSGQVELTGNSAMMEWATGSSAGHGYGTYEVVAKLDGSEPGPAIVFWPANDQWPGPEVDLAEITPNGSGQQYGTVHWNADGSNAYDAKVYDGVSGGQFHTYTMVWEPGKITMSVDGSVKATFTDHVPTDYDHGGTNLTIGAMNTNSNTSLTVDHVSYTPLDGGSSTSDAVADATTSSEASAPASTSDASTSAGVDTGHIDWVALAAQVQANYEATGHWFI